MILRSASGTAEQWAVVAVGEAVLALPDEARATELAASLAGTDGFRAVLERLVSGGIAGAPDFALIDGTAGIVRIVLRGAAEVEAGAEVISGAGVTTWNERVLEGVADLQLRVPGSAWNLGLGMPAALVPAAAVAPVPPPRADVPPADVPPPDVPPPVREDLAPHATLAPPRDDDEPEPAAEEPSEPAPTLEIGSPPTDAPPTDARPTDAPTPVEPHSFLFGDTVYRTVGGPDVRIPNPDPERPGDHDGRTVLVEELEAHEQGELPAASHTAGPTFALLLPGGAVEPLSAPLLVGRAPSDPGLDASGGAPRLVTVAAGDKDISRTHARIEVAGGAVVVTDLDSKNGTSVALPGVPPRKLRPHDPSVVLPETVIDLGGGVTMTVTESA